MLAWDHFATVLRNVYFVLDYKEGLLYRESLRMDLPGGPWTESRSTTSASSSESEDGGKQVR